MNELHLFAGIGGGILGGMLLGHRPVCAVEINPYARRVLLGRQRDGILPRFPIFGDIREFDGRPWRDIVQLVCGGFPCTDISQAKQGADGIEGEESGLWSEMARVVSEIRPRGVFIENSPMLVGRGLGRVLCDLARLGYDARWGVLGARHAGACHGRDRLWVLGYPNCSGLEGHQGHEYREGAGQDPSRSTPKTGLRLSGWKRVVHAADCEGDMDGGELLICAECGGDYGDCGCPGPTMDDELDYQIRNGVEYARPRNPWTTECGVERMVERTPHRMDRFVAVGNCQIPSVVELAWKMLGGDQLK